MSRRSTGTVLVAVSALLYASRFLAAAIFGSGVSSWNTELFNAMLHNVGPELLFWSRMAFLAGLAYLFLAEAESILKHRKVSGDE
ncbi:MAG TPA: hypothetical protein VHO49_07915 [Anaerolineales bacterium]|nr:hypothetical protein [Anaerolineales bacterium]